jgi:ATP-dependent DNA ligase
MPPRTRRIRLFSTAVPPRCSVSRFEWLRHASPPDLSTPPLFMVFDCLQARGKDLRSQPLYVRRNVVEDVLDEQEMASGAGLAAASTYAHLRELLSRTENPQAHSSALLITPAHS